MIRLIDLTLSYDKKDVMKNVFFDFPGNENIALMGVSGSGKTTLLRAVAGLLAPANGHISGAEGKIAFLFQEDRLLPWRTALQNVTLVSGDEKGALQCLEALEIGDAARQYPPSLSGGMRRRVALARALCYRGALLILDEPFQGLDERTRARAARVVLSYRTPLFIATHDQEDAELLNARIVRMEDVLSGAKQA